MDSSSQSQLQQSFSKPTTSPPRIEGSVVSPKPQSAAPTSFQIDYLIRYLELNPHIANKRCDTPGYRQHSSASWEKLANNLNRMSKTSMSKDAETWRTIWAVQKKLVKQKVEHAASRDFIHLRSQLNDRDRRILSLIDSSDDEDDSPAPQQRTVQSKSTPSEEATTTPRASDMPTEADVHSPILENPPQSSSDSIYSDEELRNILEGFTDAEIEELREPPKKKTPLVVLKPLTRSQLASVRSSKFSGKRRKSTAAASDGGERAAKPAPRQSRVSSHISIDDDDTSSSTAATPSRTTQPDSGYETTRKRRKKNHKETPAKRQRVAGLDFVPLGVRRAACLENFARAMKQMAENDVRRNEILRKTLKKQRNRAEKHTTAILSLLKDCMELLKKR